MMNFPFNFPEPGPMIMTVPDNPARPGGGGNWTRDLVGGKVYMHGQNPRHSWVSVFDPTSEFDRPRIGISGTVVEDPHVSRADNPFLHPFGNDFEFHLAPDPPFFDFVGPTMAGAYLASTRRARTDFGLNVPGVIGMEMDRGLVPAQYRPEKGDRACLWGRLIVDAGHDDFHTEIHPPLIMASARATRSTQGGRRDATIVQIISRPYLVSQEFDHGGLFNHLVVQVAEAVLNPLSRIDAHPRLMKKPFEGFNSAIFDIEPPTARDRHGDRLVIESTITQRSKGVGLTVVRHPEKRDALRVAIILNEPGYVPPPEPGRQNRTVSRAELAEDNEEVGKAVLAAILAAPAVGAPHVAAVIAQGFPTHRYFDPRAVSPGHAASTVRQLVTELPGIRTNEDDRQSFPIFGTLKLEWERELPPVPDDLVVGG